MPITKQTDDTPARTDVPKLGSAADHPRVDPDKLPAEISTGVRPDAKGSQLLAAAQGKARRSPQSSSSSTSCPTSTSTTFPGGG